MNESDARPVIPVFDPQPLLDALRSQTDQIEKSLSQLVAQFVDDQRSQIEEAARQVTQGLAFQERVVTQVVTSLSTAVERTLSDANIASKEIAGPLKAAGLWLPPSAPVYLISLLSAMVREGTADAPGVQKTILHFYAADDAEQLRQVVSDWSGNPALAKHQQIIRDAFEAHVAGKYTLSIPSLLPVVERLLTSLHGASASSGGMKDIATQHIQSSYGDFMRESSKDAVLHYITGTSLWGNVPSQYFTVEAFPAWLASQGLTERDVVNRHAILHGVQVDYAGEDNSLRVFLLIDVLSWLTRKDWDQQLKFLLTQR